tara:strand:+ start:443 stop:883 length:441 start_codon:yes stop_codon:yes gene_type:complete
MDTNEREVCYEHFTDPVEQKEHVEQKGHEDVIHLRLPDMGVEIERIGLVSSNVAALGYDLASETLEVTFTQGGRYRYGGIPTEVAAPFFKPPQFVQTDAGGKKWSHGAYFMGEVRQFAESPNATDQPRVLRYSCVEVTDAAPEIGA